MYKKMKIPGIFFFFGVSSSSLVGSCYLLFQEYLEYRRNFNLLSERLEAQTTQINKILEEVCLVESLLLKRDNTFWVTDFLTTFSKSLVAPEVLPTVLRSCFLLIVFFITKRELLNLCSFCSDFTWLRGLKGLPLINKFFTQPVTDTPDPEIFGLLQNQKELATRLGKVITKLSDDQNRQFEGVMKAFSAKSDFDEALLHSVLANFSNKILLEIRENKADTESRVLSELESLKTCLTDISVVNETLLSKSAPNDVLALPSMAPSTNLHEEFSALVAALPKDQFSL